jgi:alpha-L-fucosidase
MKHILVILLLATALCIAQRATQAQSIHETRAQYDARMKWWTEARFGMFIHWGLYAVPAGEWNGKTGYGEWIRTSAQIPLDEYHKFRLRFNPARFNAEEWVRMAKDAGMKYITITTKHHDGFCLFDSKETDFDIMSTPFRRDIMKELSKACKKAGIKLCWYHSIMDWHHPDYLPRRDWEKTRSKEGADYDRYVKYMKNQLRELLTGYGKIGVLWFDGEWESTWTRERGRDLYRYVRGLQPDIIVNNRVGAGRSGMEGFSEDESAAGDFGTPEQQIPPTGLPGVYWETCMTMNDHWGYNKNDKSWKSAKELIRMLADIASKGGNYLLNVGPTAEGVFPPESVERLREIGRWMKVNGEAIHGTQASPFRRLAWGRCTRRKTAVGELLYLHVFDRPADGRLRLSGILNRPASVYPLSNPGQRLKWTKPAGAQDEIEIVLPESIFDTMNTVITVDIRGALDITNPPVIAAEQSIFIDTMSVSMTSDRSNVEIRFTTDGSMPTAESPVARDRVLIGSSSIVSARCFRKGVAVSDSSCASYRKVVPWKDRQPKHPTNGLIYAYYEGDWDSLPDFRSLKPAKEGELEGIDFSPRRDEEHFGFVYRGYIDIPKEGVYTFHLASDDGSRLFIDDSLVVDHDGLHSASEKKGAAALAAGYHKFRLEYFEKTGGDELKLSWSGAGMKKQVVPDERFFNEQ